MKHFTYTILFSLLFCMTGLTNAQVYQWKDANGKTIFSDKPRAGQVPNKPRGGVVVESEPKAEAGEGEGGDAGKSPASDAKPTPPSPAQTWADKDMEFKKRQKEAKEKADKEEKERAKATQKSEQCDNMRRYLRSLESGERIATRDDKGEKSYMEDSARQQEIAKLKEKMQDCQ